MGEARRRYAFRDGVARESIVHDDHLTIVVRQDVERILEEIKELRAGLMRGGDTTHIARLPVPIYEDLKRRGIADDPDAFKKWLNSYAAGDWRIYQGQL